MVIHLTCQVKSEMSIDNIRCQLQIVERQLLVALAKDKTGTKDSTLKTASVNERGVVSSSDLKDDQGEYLGREGEEEEKGTTVVVVAVSGETEGEDGSFRDGAMEEEKRRKGGKGKKWKKKREVGSVMEMIVIG
ncbi:uncharacterized protein DS421_14g450200 [Arachis hypogaea]|nr:uncharacterized protein DS421_14g450200 [Arachis hypogaea]